MEENQMKQKWVSFWKLYPIIISLFPLLLNPPNTVIFKMSAPYSPWKLLWSGPYSLFFNLKDIFPVLSSQNHSTLLTTPALKHSLSLASVTLHPLVLNKLPNYFHFFLFFFVFLLMSYPLFFLLSSTPTFLLPFFCSHNSSFSANLECCLSAIKFYSFLLSYTPSGNSPLFPQPSTFFWPDSGLKFICLTKHLQLNTQVTKT